jgi:hypothetical protein
MMVRCGEKLWIINTRPPHLTYFVVMAETTPPFGRGWCGLPRQQKWDMFGRWGMEEDKVLGESMVR